MFIVLWSENPLVKIFMLFDNGSFLPWSFFRISIFFYTTPTARNKSLWICFLFFLRIGIFFLRLPQIEDFPPTSVDFFWLKCLFRYFVCHLPWYFELGWRRWMVVRFVFLVVFDIDGVAEKLIVSIFSSFGIIGCLSKSLSNILIGV